MGTPERKRWKRFTKVVLCLWLQWFIKAMKYWNAPSPSLSIFWGRQPGGHCGPCRSLLLGRSSSSLARGAGGSEKPEPGGCCALRVRRAGVAPRSSPRWGTRGFGICLMLSGCGPYSLAAVGGAESWTGVTEDSAAAVMRSYEGRVWGAPQALRSPAPTSGLSSKLH